MTNRGDLTRVGLLAWVLMIGGCAVGSDGTRRGGSNTAVPWVRTSVEYKAAALQTYQMAGHALEAMLADRAWSALPVQTDAGNLPPAIILDVDETVLDNSLYQQRHGGEFDPDTWDDWLAETAAAPIPGVVAFLKQVEGLGITPFFVTNRPCRKRAANPDPCPQERDTLVNLNSVGIATDTAHLMLLDEQPDWQREKQTRRMAIGSRYRVLMLFGDQLGDFLPCVRARAERPCTVPATAASRRGLYEQHATYWGHGWYLLPNPMYGSWSDFNQASAP
jgi:acid phosphatase